MLFEHGAGEPGGGLESLYETRVPELCVKFQQIIEQEDGG